MVFSFENLRVMRAVHRLHRKLVSLARRDAKELGAELLPMTAFFIQIFFGEVGNIHLFIARFFAERPHIVVQEVPHERAARGEERKSRANEFGKDKEVKLFAKLAMVALLRFLEHFQVFFQIIFRTEREPVDTGKHRILLAPAPIRARDFRERKRVRVYLVRLFHMASCAEVNKTACSL